MPNRGVSRHSPVYRKMLLFAKLIISGVPEVDAVAQAGYRPGSGHPHPANETCDKCRRRAHERAQWIRRHRTFRKIYDAWLNQQERSPAEIVDRTSTIAFRDPANGFRGADVVASLALLAKMKGMVKDRTEVTGADGAPLRIEFPPLAEFENSPVVQTTAISTEVHALPGPGGQEGLLGGASPRREGLDRVARHLPDDGGEA